LALTQNAVTSQVGGPITLRHRISTWALRDLTRLSQILRTFGNEYRDKVGSWQAYLSILQEK
jgi:hypothetical protein